MTDCKYRRRAVSAVFTRPKKPIVGCTQKKRPPAFVTERPQSREEMPKVGKDSERLPHILQINGSIERRYPPSC